LPRKLRRSLTILSAAGAISAAALWLWWPDADTLTGAAARGDAARVRLCLWLGVDPNTPSRWGWSRENEGQTPLTAAAQFGRTDVLRLLLDAGADPDLRDFGSESPHETPLSSAARHGQLEASRVLLGARADPNVPTYPRQVGDPGNWTALDWALQAEQPAVADLLRRHGAVEGARSRRAPE
jgi:hypothetical protein